ncbi:CYTH domain-containing protein [Halalkalibacter urbisdiaboli]|uniref:CYTH domain-containing protein n=1 Tax=Halalkalibacter urbisdiaboli TaxID=1960589 RepID=UPI000B4499DD|nr:CYTH domain-containing protein [Halalkalibacter urbisdiaboli]
MAQEIEIEVKTLISEEAYNRFLRSFNFRSDDAVVQHNHYFETKSFLLKEAQAALRIREKNETFTLTLKQPHETGLLETHQSLSSAEAKRALNEAHLPSGEVVRALKELNIPVEELSHLGTLTTSRIEFPYKGGSLCFDKSAYFDVIDYEVEFEGTSPEHAETTLTSLLQEFNLKTQPTPNKVRRFFSRKFR